MEIVRDEKGLSEALKRGNNYIEIEGKLADKTWKIKAVGKVAWVVAIGAIGVAVTAILAGTIAAPATGGVSTASYFAAIPLAAPAVGILGAGTTITAITLAVTAGGIGVLNKLRDYEVEKISNTHIKLRKKA